MIIPAINRGPLLVLEAFTPTSAPWVLWRVSPGLLQELGETIKGEICRTSSPLLILTSVLGGSNFSRGCLKGRVPSWQD